MPLAKTCNMEAYRANVAELVKSGRNQRQAVAIAVRTLKKACGVSSDKRMSPKQIIGECNTFANVKALASELKAFGAKYEDFDQVLDTFEELNIVVTPDRNDYKIIAEFLKTTKGGIRPQDRGLLMKNWHDLAVQCRSVSECIRMLNVVLEHEVPYGADELQKQAIQLANKNMW